MAEIIKEGNVGNVDALGNINKVNEITMTEDTEKRSPLAKKFVTAWDNNQRSVVVRKYNKVVHKLVEDEEAMVDAEYEDVEDIEYLAQSE